MIDYKPFQAHVRLFIELPFFEINTSLLNMSYERNLYEMLCFRIKIFKWKFELQITSNPKVDKIRRNDPTTAIVAPVRQNQRG